MLYFITGNKNKFEEVKAIIPTVEQLAIDLPEIQEIDTEKIIHAKLEVALQHATGEFIVEDTSLVFECLNGLPGPLIKWFLKAMGREGLANLSRTLGNTKATATTIIGYAKSKTDIRFFEGAIEGNIVSPRGDSGFGWDPIFMPHGHTKTFAEMGTEEKNKISHRRMALDKLKEFLGS
jgi:non-canonical purine NTP pyrophosphatase (RdgB/HAM1 family)